MSVEPLRRLSYSKAKLERLKYDLKNYAVDDDYVVDRTEFLAIVENLLEAVDFINKM